MEDSGAQQGFDAIGHVTVGRAGPAVSPNNDDEPKDRPPRLTEAQKRQRERTNRGNKDDESTEGDVAEVGRDADGPSISIVNRDGRVRLVLVKEARKAVDSIRVADYVEADGWKEREHLFYAESVKAVGH